MERSSCVDSPSSDVLEISNTTTGNYNLFGFGKELRYSAEELASRTENASETNAEAEPAVGDDAEDLLFAWPPQSRVGNTRWWECGSKFAVMANRLDCLCCQDAAVTLELVRTHNVSCVTEVPDFGVVILHKGVLTTALRGYFEMRKEPLKPTEEPDNRYVLVYIGSAMRRH